MKVTQKGAPKTKPRRRRNVMGKNTRQTIVKSMGRYIAIVAIIALGSGMFVGLLSTKSDMVATAQKYLDEQNMFDLRLISSYGWTKEEVQRIGVLSGVADAEGSISVDAFANLGSPDESTVYRIHSIPDRVNQVFLIEGRMPENPNECLLDSHYPDQSVIGTEFVISEENDQDTLDSFRQDTYTVVGLINSPLYLDVFRGNTTLGDGSLTGFVYLQPEAFEMEYYTEIGVTIQGDYEVYTEAYTEAMEQMAKQLEADVTAIGQERMLELKADAEAEYSDGLAQYEAAFAQFQKGREEAYAALDARLEMEPGWTGYEAAKAQLDAQFAQTEAMLLETKEQLEEAQKQLDEIPEAEVYILDRNTHQGYLAVDNNSNIVSGVSRVFPAFFLLVAALVCITTMTRMVDEERTQIGILKALGYSNGAIISKYLVYTGSAAVLGCGLGTMIGSMVFPMILWEAYGIILTVCPQIVLKMNWPLCFTVVGAYTAVSMLVTWYCCRRELREAPAELIRPRAPEPGKKILLEHLPFWNKIGFLNKVMFRNVFRYRQRLLMMLLGICGCTALLLTGFGLRDSIMHIVDNQFDDVMVYDMEVYFSESQTPEAQSAFRDALEKDASSVHFFHQSGMELEFDGKTKDVYMMVSDEAITQYVHLQKGSTKLDMPGINEIVITINAAERLGISVGDTVILRDPELKSLTLTVVGIFDNHVQNFAVVRPETVQQQWGYELDQQMAFVQAKDGVDVHSVGAAVSAMDDVMNVSVSEDAKEQVQSMMEALDLVVITIVICAGLLAIIVLYNLTNISITERIREIATIKVLGFNAKETAMYVFKENLLLTGMGTAIGLVGGIFLLRFVISQIKVDLVWMYASLSPLSYVWAVLLTGLSAVVVDFLLYFKLEKINMAEALKSVE